MKSKTFILTLTLCFVNNISAHAEKSDALDSTQIENLTGAKGDYISSTGVFKVTVPHKDLKASTTGLKLNPALGLTSKAAFKKTGNEAEVSGDMVLIEDQVNIVMKEALDNGLQITALHNQYLWEAPKLMFMHIEGKGSVSELASAVGKVFETVKKSSKGTLWSIPPTLIDPQKTTFDIRNIEAILGAKGTKTDGVYRVEFEKETTDGSDRELTLEDNSWAAFVGTDKYAALLGNFVMKENEAQNVLKTLIKHNVYIVSLYEKTNRDNSKTLVVHYIKRGPAVELAKELKETLAQTSLKAVPQT